jgi:hypothetical protein
MVTAMELRPKVERWHYKKKLRKSVGVPVYKKELRHQSEFPLTKRSSAGWLAELQRKWDGEVF